MRNTRPPFVEEDHVDSLAHCNRVNRRAIVEPHPIVGTDLSVWNKPGKASPKALAFSTLSAMTLPVVTFTSLGISVHESKRHCNSDQRGNVRSECDCSNSYTLNAVSDGRRHTGDGHRQKRERCAQECAGEATVLRHPSPSRSLVKLLRLWRTERTQLQRRREPTSRAVRY